MLLQAWTALETPKPTSGEIGIDASAFETANVLFFDRYRIEPHRDFFELHFGFYGQASDARSGLIVVISRKAVAEAQKSLLQYLQQLGEMPEPRELPECNLRAETTVVTADILGLARHGAVAEIIFHVFSWRTVVQKVRADVKQQEMVNAICTALLRCDLDLQKQWILGLYEDETNDESH